MAPRDELMMPHPSRRLALRMRPDLTADALEFESCRYWSVKDPIALKYFQLGEEEYFLLNLLNGRTSMEEITRRFNRTFAPLQLTVDRLYAFLARMHRSGLLVSDALGQGEQLLERHRRNRRRRRWAAWSNVLALRFRGVDPEPLLKWLYPAVRPLFSRWFLFVCLTLVLAAATLVTVQFDVVWSRLPELGAFFEVRNLAWLAVALGLVKVLHELCHALACKHFGGECHEIGIMFLVFTPCLYCNVSDSWRLPNKWHRASVAAAGIGVELVLASIATFLWWFSHPGGLNALALNVMVVCSVGTVLFNGNPLLRYDGYYVLSDLVEVPNLWERSRALVRHSLTRWCLGIDEPDDHMTPRRNRTFLVVYAVTSIVYRLVLIGTILWIVHESLGKQGLQAVAQGITAMVVIGMAIGPVVRGKRFFEDPWRRRQIDRWRLAITCLAMAAILAAFGFTPMPYRIAAPAVLEYHSAERVYVSVPGKVVEALPVGTKVENGDALVRLQDLNLRKEVLKLEGEVRQQRQFVRNLESRRSHDPSAGSQIPAAQEALDSLEKRLHQRLHEEQELVLTAPVDGMVLPAPRRATAPSTAGRLVSWSGYASDQRNIGSFLDVGTLVCLVGEPARLWATLYVDETDVEFVREGQTVRLRLAQLPGETLTGTIEELARIDSKIAPRQLASEGDLPARPDDEGSLRPLDTSYQARVALIDAPSQLRAGVRGRARIVADPQTLVQRLGRYLARTF